MRILYLVQQFPKSTSETFILSEMIALQKMGHDVWVLTDWINYDQIATTHALIAENDFMSKVIGVDTYSRGVFKLASCSYKIIKDFLSNPIRCGHNLRVAFSKLPGHRQNFWSKIDNYLILRKIFKIKFDFIYSPFAPIEKIERGLIIARAYQVPFASAWRALELYGERYEKNIRDNKELYGLINGLVTISEFNKRYLAAKFGFDQLINVVHSSIDPNKFLPPVLKNTNNKLEIITVARFVEKKGIIYLLEALANLLKENLNFSYTLIGAGPLEETYLAKIKELKLEKNVTILKPVNQEKIKELLEKSDMLILPCIVAADGDRDILANVLKEAMSMELAVITSDISGIEELIENNKSGILVPEKNSIALENAIRTLALNPELRLSLGQEGRKKIIADFNVKYEAEKLNQVFNDILENYKISNTKITFYNNQTDEREENKNNDLEFYFTILQRCGAMLVIPVYQAIYRYARLAQEGDILELGSRYGAATICLAKGIRDSKKKSHLFAVESGGNHGSSLSKLGSKEDNIALLKENIDYFNFSYLVTVIPKPIRETTEYFSDIQKFSLLLIDADGQLDRDFPLFYNRLKPGAKIIIDDYENMVDLEKGTDNNPLGKGYTTYQFVEYFLRKGLIKKEQLVEHTLFCFKPNIISGSVEINIEDLKKIRQKIRDKATHLKNIKN